MKKEKESIQLKDFIKEAIVAIEKELGEELLPLPGPTYQTYKNCPTCNKNQSKETKFCPADGTELVDKQYEVINDDYDDYVRDMLYDLSEGAGCPPTFGYEYVDSIEKRGDGSGYYMNFIFKRKSDGKFFYYTSYDGRIEEDELDETKQKVTVKWDFEKNFS